MKVEVDAERLLRAVGEAISGLGSKTRNVDAIALSVMSPSWVAMDRNGRAITPIITHQDRRSTEIAGELEKRVGEKRHLRIAGNRPFPGSISSTTLAWFLRHEPGRMKRADLLGHVNTLVHRRLTGQRIVDPSNASFMGLYRTCDLGGWSDELCQAAGAKKTQLPEIIESNVIAGRITSEAATEFGLQAGTPVTAGMVDTGAAMMCTGAQVGQLFHVCGSTDVLAVVAAQAHPHPRLLTRALGIGRKWLSVYTLAAGGSTLDWMHREFFSDFSTTQFRRLTTTLVHERPSTIAQFSPYLAGERAAMQQRQADFTGLTLATTRREMLAAAIESLSAASAARLPLLVEAQPTFRREVFFSGGQGILAEMMHRDWPGRWKYRYVKEASLAGLAQMNIES